MRHAIDRIVNFTVLGIILGTGMFAYFALRGNQFAQLLTGIIIAVAYAVWGLIHHAIIGDIHRKIVVEYVLISAIAVTVLLVILGI